VIVSRLMSWLDCVGLGRTDSGASWDGASAAAESLPAPLVANGDVTPAEHVVELGSIRSEASAMLRARKSAALPGAANFTMAH